MNEEWGASIPQVVHGAGTENALAFQTDDWLVTEILKSIDWEIGVCVGREGVILFCPQVATEYFHPFICSLSEKQDSPWNNALRTLFG